MGTRIKRNYTNLCLHRGSRRDCKAVSLHHRESLINCHAASWCWKLLEHHKLLVRRNMAEVVPTSSLCLLFVVLQEKGEMSVTELLSILAAERQWQKSFQFYKA